jgi:transposase InsO family protein
LVAPNRLEQNVSVVAPDLVWATDTPYIRTFEGWLYLAVVVDLYSRIVVGWSMRTTLTRDLVVDALLMAIWRRLREPVIVHSDQGSQYGSNDAVRFFKDHHLIPSMSRRGNGRREVLQELILFLRHEITSGSNASAGTRFSSPGANSFWRRRYAASLSNVGGSAGS